MLSHKPDMGVYAAVVVFDGSQLENISLSSLVCHNISKTCQLHMTHSKWVAGYT